MKNKWICIDQSINKFGKKIRDNIYEFKQEIINPDGSKNKDHTVINLKEYDSEEKELYLFPFSRTLKIYDQMSKEDADWLLATAIFTMISV